MDLISLIKTYSSQASGVVSGKDMFRAKQYISTINIYFGLTIVITLLMIASAVAACAYFINYEQLLGIVFLVITAILLTGLLLIRLSRSRWICANAEVEFDVEVN